MASSIYDFTVKDQQGNDVSLADYRGSRAAGGEHRH